MLGHPGGEEHSRYLIELSFLPPPPPGGWIWVPGTEARYGCYNLWAMKRRAST